MSIYLFDFKFKVGREGALSLKHRKEKHSLDPFSVLLLYFWNGFSIIKKAATLSQLKLLKFLDKFETGPRPQ